MSGSGDRKALGSRAIARRREEIRRELRAKFPAVMRLPEPPFDRSAIVLGRSSRGSVVLLPERPRLEHMFVCGTTGGGKSKLLELCIRRDICAGRGVLVIDPHGEHPQSLYRSLLSWIKAREIGNRRTVHLIDPSAPTHTIGFNPLARPDPETDFSVISGQMLEAFSRAWRDEDTSRKPTIERVLTTVFSALCELELSLVEAPLLLDRRDRHGLRRHAIEKVTDAYTRDELQRLHELSQDERRRQDFDLEVLGPLNRLARFVRPPAIRAMLGQTETTLDFREALDEGHVILANLSGSARIYETDADLLGRLIVRSLFFHAKRRRRPDRAFVAYLDESHRYLSGDIENILAESRKYGVAAVLAAQWLAQYSVQGDNMLAAVLNATNVKAVFRGKDPEESARLAEMVIAFDLEIPVRGLIKPTVIGHRRSTLANASDSRQRSVSHSHAETTGESESHGWTESYGTSVTDTENESFSEAETASWGVSNSSASSVGVSEGISSSESVQSGPGLFGAPTDVSVSSGSESARNRSATNGNASMRSGSTSSGRTHGSSHSVSTFEMSSESYSYSTHRARTHGVSETEGEGRSQGWSEAFEPEYANLPSAMHSIENVRYMAGQMVRNLRTGYAVLNYVGPNGMVAHLLRVAPISAITMSPCGFEAWREQVLSTSPSALPRQTAQMLVEQRQHALPKICQHEDEPEPVTFRTKAPPLAPERDQTPPAAAGRSRPRRGKKKAGME